MSIKKINCFNQYPSLQYEKLDFGESNVLSSFYNADVVIVDLSLTTQRSTISYQLGMRESFNMKQNILIYNDLDSETTLRFKVFIIKFFFVSFLFIYYIVAFMGQLYICFLFFICRW